MARMPDALWRPVPNRTPGGQETVRGVVLHVMQGSLEGSDSWFRNTASSASAHFGVGKDGRIWQWVDTADRAWAQASGNREWLSIEHEGYAGQPLTAKQLAATAKIIAWAAKTHHFPIQLADSATTRGVGWHGMGGSAWGGHLGCPGDRIVKQRADLVAAAKDIAGDTTPAASTYTVKKGDTLSDIAADHGLSLDALLTANPAYKSHPDDITPGDKLTLPASTRRWVTVKKGDTLSDIAHSNHTTPGALRKLNPQIKDPDRINVGDKIRIK